MFPLFPLFPPLHAHATTIRSGGNSGNSGNNGFDYFNGGSSNNGGEQVVEASAVSALRHGNAFALARAALDCSAAVVEHAVTPPGR